MTGNTPTSPRLVQIDPHIAPPRSHSIQIASPSALTPSREGGHGLRHRQGAGGRSYRDDAEGARERQMQQDLESAMSMSRARSGSMAQADTSPIHRPSIIHYPSTSPIRELSPPHMHPHQHSHHSSFPMLSDLEEAEMDRAREPDITSDDEHHGRGYHPEDSHMDEETEGTSGGGSERGLLMRRSRSDEGRRGRGQGGSGAAIGSTSSGVGRELRRHAGERGGMGMPRGGEEGRSHFNFGEMEDFARKERGELGLDSGDVSKGSADVKGAGISWGDEARRKLRMSEEGMGNGSGSIGMDRTATMSDHDHEHEHEHDGEAFSPSRQSEAGSAHAFHRRRQRKLSQSNPVLRRQGKLALFEGFGSQATAPAVDDNNSSAVNENGIAPFKAARQAKNALGGPAGGFTPYTDAAGAGGHDRPYRFSFYSNALPVTIHARSLTELPAEGQTFEDLFKGKNSGAEDVGQGRSTVVDPDQATEYGSVKGEAGGQAKLGMLERAAGVANAAGGGGSSGKGGADEDPEAFTWWLDVLSPTDEEMRMLSKVFGIHPLTTEDILLEETREKIELFRNYYLVCFRSFDQDPYSQTYLEPLNMYIIVFREGTLSFHFRGTPHPQNVRRRIKHLKDYISVTSDWISYALIDDITDAFGPLIQSIEYEVDSIDELVLILKEAEQSDMLRRIGTCRKKVMGLLRLMGNKADVVKGLAKRCNEQWLVAPKSDIGLYLSDIQDHLITMTQNLNHYEKILSRSHSNYLAQISIEMTDANNQINDVLSKLTALGTVLIPMNLVTGLWGMNVHVPGQDIETGYAWFGGILGCLAAFAVLGAWATYKCFVVSR